jgi:predicted transposase YbfD/YdcC
LRVVLGQVEVPAGTNEIPTIQTLLEDLVLEGKVVTVDALLTQHDIAETIRKKGGTT